MNLRHPLRTSMRINYTVLYIMLRTVSRLRGGTVPSMDGVLKMLGHVELLHIASIINCIPQCYQAPVELRLLLAYECHPWDTAALSAVVAGPSVKANAI